MNKSRATFGLQSKRESYEAERGVRHNCMLNKHVELAV